MCFVSSFLEQEARNAEKCLTLIVFGPIVCPPRYVYFDSSRIVYSSTAHQQLDNLVAFALFPEYSSNL